MAGILFVKIAATRKHPPFKNLISIGGENKSWMKLDTVQNVKKVCGV